MKTLPILAATVALISCSTPEPEVVSIPNSEQKLVLEATANSEASLLISGMTCETGCKGAIEGNLRRSSGVLLFDIDFADSSAAVIFDSTIVSVDEIINRITAVGGGDFYSASLSN